MNNFINMEIKKAKNTISTKVMLMFIIFIAPLTICYGMKRPNEKIAQDNIKKTTLIHFYFSQTIFTLGYSIVEDIFNFEKRNFNQWCFIWPYSCWGYRYKPVEWTSYIEFNINILGGGTHWITTIILLYKTGGGNILNRSILERWHNNVNKLFSLLNFVLTFLNVNFNLNIYKNNYVAINILGIINCILSIYTKKEAPHESA